MRAAIALAAALLVAVSPAARAAGKDKDKPKVAVLELGAASKAAAQVARLSTRALTQELARDGSLQVTSSAEVAEALGLQAQQALMGCTTPKCVTDLSGRLSVDRIVVGEVGLQGGQVLVFVAYLDVKTGSALARSSVRFHRKSQQLKEQLALLARNLTNPDAGGADEPLKSMSIAVAFDELDSNTGRPVLRRPLEKCVAGELEKLGTTPVSSSMIQSIKRKSGVRQLMQGGVPDDLTPAEVDVLLVGFADYYQSDVGRGHRGVNVRGDASVQLINVGNGEILASFNGAGAATEITPPMAQSKAAHRVCTKITPGLQEALARRVVRGERVVVTVAGVLDAQAGEELRAAIVKLPAVGRARLRRVADGEAQIEAWVLGGGANRLALALADLSLTATKVEDGALTASRAE